MDLMTILLKSDPQKMMIALKEVDFDVNCLSTAIIYTNNLLVNGSCFV